MHVEGFFLKKNWGHRSLCGPYVGPLVLMFWLLVTRAFSSKARVYPLVCLLQDRFLKFTASARPAYVLDPLNFSVLVGPETYCAAGMLRGSYVCFRTTN